MKKWAICGRPWQCISCKSIGRISRAIGPPSLRSIFPRRFLHRGLVAYKTVNAVINCVCGKQLQNVKRNTKSFHENFPPSKHEHQKRAITERIYITDTLLSLLRYVFTIAIVFLPYHRQGLSSRYLLGIDLHLLKHGRNAVS